MKKLSKFEKKTFMYLQLLLFMYSLGGVFSKLAATYRFFSVGYIFCYSIVLLILVIYAIGWQQIIKRLPLFTAYASKAVTVIWGLLWGVLLFKEHIAFANIIGAVVIVIGIFLVVSEEK